jgi:hypothetical protein
MPSSVQRAEIIDAYHEAFSPHHLDRQWIGADTDETALGRRACNPRQKVFEFAKEIFFVFKKRLHLDINL